MNRAITSRFLALRRIVQQQPKRSGSGGHHDIVNSGPPVTFDLAPVPFQSYQKVYGELQAKFNVYLGVSVLLFIGAFTFACYEDVFAFEAIRPPQSYRNRK